MGVQPLPCWGGQGWNLAPRASDTPSSVLRASGYWGLNYWEEDRKGCGWIVGAEAGAPGRRQRGVHAGMYGVLWVPTHLRSHLSIPGLTREAQTRGAVFRKPGPHRGL